MVLKAFAEQYQMDFVEVSAISANNINAAFLLLVQQIHLKSTGKLKKKKKTISLSQASSSATSSLQGDRPEEESSSSCCDCGFFHRSKAQRRKSFQYQTNNTDSINPLLSGSDAGDSASTSLMAEEDLVASVDKDDKDDKNV